MGIMMNKTNIEYLDYSWNPTHGCSPVSPGCDNCWAKATSKRLAGMAVRSYWKYDPFKVTCCPWKLDEPLKIKKPSRIGVSFMGDLFHEDVPDNFIEQVLNICAVSQHTFLILTKRPERMRDIFKMKEDRDGFYGHPSIWLGVTAENQEQADKRIPILLQIPAAKRFVSIEPMLGAVDLFDFFWEQNPNFQPPRFLDEGETYTVPHRIRCDESPDWVIIGAESGAGRRYCEHHSIRKIVEQCQSAGVPVFVKQLHMLYKKSQKKYATWVSKNPAEWPEDLRVQKYPR